jgi:hypothetical protein
METSSSAGRRKQTAHIGDSRKRWKGRIQPERVQLQASAVGLKARLGCGGGWGWISPKLSIVALRAGAGHFGMRATDSPPYPMRLCACQKCEQTPLRVYSTYREGEQDGAAGWMRAAGVLESWRAELLGCCRGQFVPRPSKLRAVRRSGALGAVERCRRFSTWKAPQRQRGFKAPKFSLAASFSLPLFSTPLLYSLHTHTQLSHNYLHTSSCPRAVPLCISVSAPTPAFLALRPRLLPRHVDDVFCTKLFHHFQFDSPTHNLALT